MSTPSHPWPDACDPRISRRDAHLRIPREWDSIRVRSWVLSRIDVFVERRDNVKHDEHDDVEHTRQSCVALWSHRTVRGVYASSDRWHSVQEQKVKSLVYIRYGRTPDATAGVHVRHDHERLWKPDALARDSVFGPRTDAHMAHARPSHACFWERDEKNT